MPINQERIESLGPAEKIIQALTTWTDHIVHNRPGVVVKDETTKLGVRWSQATWQEKDGIKTAYMLSKTGRKVTKIELGKLSNDNKIRNGRRVVGEYRKPGLFPEAVEYLYKQAAEVWKMDNEFAARWASWAFTQDHKDMKVILAALMLVQDRHGGAVVEDGEILFHDDDFRAVGEAMCLVKAKNDINPKLLLRIGDILALPGVAKINRALGFGKSARRPAIGRYYKTVEKWLRYREENPRVLEGLVKAGFKTTTMALARKVGYKPSTQKFFETLRWKQKQSKDGHRSIGLDMKLAEVKSWDSLSEKEICEEIIKDKPGYKKIVGMLPKNIGLTRAIMAAAIEAGSVSNQDLIILTPTLEDLGLLTVKNIKVRWEDAIKSAENQRAANIAKRVKSRSIRENLEDAAEKVIQKSIKEVVKDLRFYVIVDKSGSMEGALEEAKVLLEKMLIAFPLEKLHVSVFNSFGTEIKIKSSSAKAIEHAFKGHRAGGGTVHATGVGALEKYKPQKNEDSIVIFVGDQGEWNGSRTADAIIDAKWNPVAIGMLNIRNSGWTFRGHGNHIYDTASRLGIPCFDIDKEIFSDPYSTVRNLRNLIASTPVDKSSNRVSLVEDILKTDLLEKPVWA